MELVDVIVYGGVAVVILYTVSKLFGTTNTLSQVPARPKRQTMEKRDLTLEELRKYDGSDPTSPILMGVKGIIYDVTSGAGFYGPGGAYASFSGKDASRALAKGVTDENVASDAKLDDLTKDELDTLNEWASHYATKYEVIGKVIQ